MAQHGGLFVVSIRCRAAEEFGRGCLPSYCHTETFNLYIFFFLKGFYFFLKEGGVFDPKT